MTQSALAVAFATLTLASGCSPGAHAFDLDAGSRPADSGAALLDAGPPVVDAGTIPASDAALAMPEDEGTRDDTAGPGGETADADRITLCDSPAGRAGYGRFAELRTYPLVVHRVVGPGGELAVSDATIADQVRMANELFAPANVRFEVQSQEDLRISDHFHIDDEEERFAMLREHATPGAIDVFFARSMYGGYGGAATFPHYTVQGILLTAAASPDTLGHELGHYANALHQHEGLGVELVDRTNCTATGDLLCGTAADPGPSWLNATRGCALVPGTCGLARCGVDARGATYSPAVSNTMSYYGRCRSGFAPEQLQLMTCVLDRVRLELAPAAPPPGPTCAPDETACEGGCRDLATDPNHCGACDRACAAHDPCVLGRCCVGPYHVATGDGRCVWSCGTNTTPDVASGTCVCRAGFTPSGVDGFGRRVCSCAGPYHVTAPDGRCVWSCGEGTTPSTATNECVCRPGLRVVGADRFGRRICR